MERPGDWRPYRRSGKFFSCRDAVFCPFSRLPCKFLFGIREEWENKYLILTEKEGQNNKKLKSVNFASILFIHLHRLTLKQKNK